MWLHTIMEAHDNWSCGVEMCAIAAACSTQRSIFLRPNPYRYASDEIRTSWVHPLSDHITLMNVLHAYVVMRGRVETIPGRQEWCSANFLSYETLEEAYSTRNQVAMMIEKDHLNGRHLSKIQFSHPEYYNNIRRSLARGLFIQSAIHHKDDVYKTVHENQEALLHAHSALVSGKHEWVVWTDLTITGKQYLQTVTAVESEWIEVFLHSIKSDMIYLLTSFQDLPYFDEKRMPRRAPDPTGFQPLLQPQVLRSLQAARARKAASAQVEGHPKPTP